MPRNPPNFFQSRSFGFAILPRFLLRIMIFIIGAGWSSPEARRAHNPKVVGSNPTPATRESAGHGRCESAGASAVRDRVPPDSHQFRYIPPLPVQLRPVLCPTPGRVVVQTAGQMFR
jgi:hypothetical protein